MKFSSAIRYLNGFINYEKVSYNYPRDLKLARVKALLEEMGVDYTGLPAVHIAGTKGKGSVATIIAYTLAASGYRVGLYTSPHFHDFRERIRILSPHSSGVREELISKKEVVGLVGEFKPVFEKRRVTREFGKLSFFEVYTAIAFSYFSRKGFDFVVLEVGLGGRLDATNVVVPFVSVITHIGYDHMSKLGGSLSQIAYEKAGIIKRNIPVVVSSQRRSPLDVIRKKCRRERAEMFLYGRDFSPSRVKIKKYGTSFDFTFRDFFVPRLRVPLLGIHQVENASVASAVLCVLKERGAVDKVDFRRGLSSVRLEGRFEIVSTRPLVVMDIAHNVSAFCVLQKSLKTYFPYRKVILIFGASRDKDVRGMLKSIRYHRLILAPFSNPRSFPVPELKKQVRVEEAITASDVKDAFKIAYKYYNKNHLILVAGSFFLVAEAKRAFNHVRSGRV